MAYPRELFNFGLKNVYTHSSLADELVRLLQHEEPVKVNVEVGVGSEEDDWLWNGVEVDPHLNEWIPPMGRPVLKRQKNKKLLPTECVFCKNNREDPKFYQSHILKDFNGKVRCPVLRAYECPICGISGDKAHTIKYCPANQGQVTTMGSVKTVRTSTGKRRVPAHRNFVIKF
uniref:Nanos-type domain-containing protein n=1 Tax=Strigamia maritima TaxID=126957 RepID=T1IIX6_STRMM